MSEALPDHWNTTSIEKSAYLRGRIGWQGLRADEFIEDGPYLVTGTDFKDGKIDWSTCYHVTEARYREAAPIQLRDDDLLVTKDGTIGKVAHVSDCPDHAVLNSGVFLVRCSDGSFRHRWLYHLLTSSHFEKFLRQNLAGSTINHLYQYVFEKYEFPVPQSDKEQKKLCKIIDLIDTQIEATEALIAKQERLRAGLMQDLFTRGVGENGELRPPREEAPHLYHETTMGWLPRSWHVSSIAKVGRIKGGKRMPAGSDFAETETAFPYLRVVDLVGGSVDGSDLQYVPAEIQPKIARYVISHLDLYVTIAGTIGSVGCIPRHLSGAQLTENAARVTEIDFRQVCLGYLWRVMASEIVQKQIWREMGIGGGVPKLALFRIESLNIPLPSIVEQRRLILKLARMERLLSTELQKLDLLKASKSGLMQDLLTGTVSVEPLLEKEPA